MRRPDLLVFEHQHDLFATAATALAQQATVAVAARGRFLLVISGGGTPRPLYRLLAQPPYRDDLPWAKTHVFWADERMVPPVDDESNYHQAWSVWLQHVPIPREQIHAIDGELTPESAAGDYANKLAAMAPPGRAWPRFDLVLLGLGADGHTASLFPGSPHPLPAATPTLPVTADYGGRPAQRVTLTPPAINSARHVIFLVTGSDKAGAVAQTLAPKGDPRALPARRIQPEHGQLSWFLDRDAAARLQQTPRTTPPPVANS
ncbi:MAG: 6-phosphogluconolactonase [Anaerolineae bacterium]|nr:6-phosphogluconolactonase [Anaerolineae bacterium]